MPGLLHVRSCRHVWIVLSVEGWIIILLSIYCALVHLSLPPRGPLLVAACSIWIGWKIYSHHSRTLAVFVALLLSIAAVVSYRQNGLDGFTVGLMASLFIAIYGVIAAIASVSVCNRSLQKDRAKIRAMIYVTMSISCTLLFGLGLIYIIPELLHKPDERFAIVIMPFFLFGFCEPLLRYLGRVHDEDPTSGVRRIWSVICGLLLGVVATILHRAIEEGATKIAGLTIPLVVALMFVPGQVTGAWVNGVSKRRSWWTGASRGFLLGVMSIAFLWAIVDSFPDQGIHPDFWGHLGYILNSNEYKYRSTDTTDLTYEWEVLAVSNGLLWGLLGCAGGLALDAGKGRRALFVNMVFAALFFVLALRVFGVNFADQARLGVVQFGIVAGWIIGLVINPSAKGLLERSSSAPAG